MSTGVGCRVLIDGAPVPDGSAGDDPTAPAVLSGLEVTWGRSTTMDQPDMSTCTFELYDVPGGVGYTGLHPGARVDVQASGVIYPDPDQATFVDPGFDTGQAATIVANTTAAVTTTTTAGVPRVNRSRNPNLETNATHWQANGGATIARSTAQAHSGAASLAITTTGTSGQGCSQPLAGVLAVDSTATPVTVSAWVLAPVGFPYRIAAQEYTPGSVLVGTVNGPNQTGTGTWQRVSATITPTTVGNFVRTTVLATAAHTAVTFYVDDSLVEQSGSLGAYFDGSTPDTAATDYAWTGAVDGSPSTATPLVQSGPFLRAVPVNPAARATVTVAPAPFTDIIGGWDTIPVTAPGQVWSMNVRARAPAGARLEVRAVQLTGTTADDPVEIIPNTTRLVVADGAWHTVVWSFYPTAAGRWVGIQATSFPTGPTWDQVAPALTWDTVPGDLTWDALAAIDLDNVQVLAPVMGTTRTVDVFVGRITDLEAGWDEDAGVVVAKVVAVDLIADLENRAVGDDPWPAEPMGVRAQRIVDLAGLPIPLQVAPELGELVVSWRDVDRTGAFDLLGSLATSTDGVLWPAAHTSTGSYLVLEDLAARRPLLELTTDAGLIVVVVSDDPVAGVLDLTACDLLRDPVRWLQSVSDVLTRAAVSWLEQTTDDEGQPATVEHTTELVDDALEAVHGTRAVSIGTELTTEGDAADVAARVLARSPASSWRAAGLTLDDAWTEDTTPADVTTVLDLLDGTRRIGAGIVLGDMPGDWTPVTGGVPVYAEGGTYTFDGGAWVLALEVSNAVGQGQSAAWDELDPAWTWDQWHPALTWNDLRGAAAPNDLGA